jgi:RHS repeat-associated protein
MPLGVAGADGATWFASDWRGSARPTDPWGTSERDDGLAPGFLGELGIGGLLWLRNRVYDPSGRQFLSRDPIAGTPGTAVANHPYHYAANDPINMMDPLGLSNQPVSIEEYQQYKKEATGFQWANVAVVVAGIVGTALIFTPLGPLALAGISAGLGMGVNMARQVGDQGRSFGEIDWGQQLRAGVGSAIFGGLGGVVGRPMAGFFTAGAGRVLGPVSSRVVGTAAAGGSFGTFSQAVQEGYDATGLPGSDGRFDTNWVLLSGTFGVIGGGIGGARPVPPPGAPPQPNLTFRQSLPIVGGSLVQPAIGNTVALVRPDNPEISPVPSLPGLQQPPTPDSFPTPPPPTYPLDPHFSAPGLKPILHPISGGTHCH